MSHLLDDEDELTRPDREVTLSGGAIFGIFVGLVLLCGLFFALGFNMGSHHSSSTSDTATTDTPSGPSTNFRNFKPAAGSPAGSSSSYPAPHADTSTQATTPAAPQQAHTATTTPTASTSVTESAPATHTTTATPSPAAPTPTSTPTGPPGNFMVQVAAVSHQEDADILLSALKAKGYAVFPRSEPQDKLIHIQIGPFTSRKDAETMRQRFLADGYNAIIK